MCEDVLRAALLEDLPWIFSSKLFLLFSCPLLFMIPDSLRVCVSWGRFCRYHSTLPEAFPGASAGFWFPVRVDFSSSRFFPGQVGWVHPESPSSLVELCLAQGCSQPGESAGGTVTLACAHLSLWWGPADSVTQLT